MYNYTNMKALQFLRKRVIPSSEIIGKLSLWMVLFVLTITTEIHALAPPHRDDQLAVYEGLLRKTIEKQLGTKLEQTPFSRLREAFERKAIDIPKVRIELRDHTILCLLPNHDAVFALNDSKGNTRLTVIPDLLWKRSAMVLSLLGEDELQLMLEDNNNYARQIAAVRMLAKINPVHAKLGMNRSG